MDTPELDALIDDYLLGTITPVQREWLEKRMAADPEFAENVRHSQLAFRAIQLERNRLLKEKLKQLDQTAEAKPPKTTKRTAVLISMAGLIILLFFLVSIYESPACIAKRNLLEVAEVSIESQEMWDNAVLAFLEADYDQAIRDFVTLAGDQETPCHYAAEWNVLMAQLALAGPGPVWHMALDAYIAEAPEPLAARAQMLKRKLESVYYRLLFSPMREKFSAIKPRLI
jgi:hypothetical protein